MPPEPCPVRCAIVLAGGLGTRLRSAVPDLPKPMAPVAGRPFLEHQLDYWIAQGIRRFVLAVGYRHEAIVDHFGSSYRGAQIVYSIETVPAGTGGGLAMALAHAPADEPVLVLNGDTYFEVDLSALSAFAHQHDTDWCLALFRADEPGRYMGLSVEADGRIGAMRADDLTPGRLANGGVYRVHPRAVRDAVSIVPPASLERDLFPAWLDAGRRFHGLVFDGSFIDIGVPDDWRRAARVLPATAACDTGAEGDA
jgi:D-glycero-alpha-D-manno-heptose 1-phosphate guanylyltransferase